MNRFSNTPRRRKPNLPRLKAPRCLTAAPAKKMMAYELGARGARMVYWGHSRKGGDTSMIQIIYGRKGTGKTKRIIDLANQSIDSNKGEIVFIDDDNRYMFDLRHEARFVNAKEYDISSPNMFFGFLCGIVAANYDMNEMYVDGFLRLVEADLNDLGSFFQRLEEMAEKNNLHVVIATSGPDEAPEYLKKYII
jgi:hypothetical protein